MSFEIDCPRCGRRATVTRWGGILMVLCWHCGHSEPYCQLGVELAKQALRELRDALSVPMRVGRVT